MGDMGPGKQHGRKKRIVRNGRRRRRNSEVLDWVSDRYRKPSVATKRVARAWLAESFSMSNAHRIPKVANEDLETMANEMMEVASVMGGVDECKITLTEPQDGDPYYESDIEMIIDGTRHDIVLTSLDLNDLLTSAVGWINRRGIR